MSPLAESLGDLVLRTIPVTADRLVPEIVERGETSIVYAGGAFSHAVVKRAKDGEFRVQKDFGGRVESASPEPALLSFAASVMTHVPNTCLYARVDVERGVEVARAGRLALFGPRRCA